MYVAERDGSALTKNNLLSVSAVLTSVTSYSQRKSQRHKCSFLILQVLVTGACMARG